jgi:hypothetical protein
MTLSQLSAAMSQGAKVIKRINNLASFAKFLAGPNFARGALAAAVQKNEAPAKDLKHFSKASLRSQSSSAEEAVVF